MQADVFKLSIPEYWQEWYIDSVSNKLTVPFKGKRISIIGNSDNKSGYAWVRIKDKEAPYFITLSWTSIAK